MKAFLIYSNERQAWWKAEGMGYTEDMSAAGRFTLEEASKMRLDGVKTPEDLASADVIVQAR